MCRLIGFLVPVACWLSGCVIEAPRSVLMKLHCGDRSECGILTAQAADDLFVLVGHDYKGETRSGRQDFIPLCDAVYSDSLRAGAVVCVVEDKRWKFYSRALAEQEKNALESILQSEGAAKNCWLRNSVAAGCVSDALKARETPLYRSRGWKCPEAGRCLYEFAFP